MGDLDEETRSGPSWALGPDPEPRIWVFAAAGEATAIPAPHPEPNRRPNHNHTLPLLSYMFNTPSVNLCCRAALLHAGGTDETTKRTRLIQLNAPHVNPNP